MATSYGALSLMAYSGDSYSTVGFWAGGQLPSPSNPIGNPGLPGQTTSAGLNWVGHVTSTLNTSLILTYDFAYSGATIDKKIVNSWAQYSMSDQVALYKQYVSPTMSTDDSLVAIWIGINDVGEAFWSKTSALVNECVGRYFELLQSLVDEGFDKFVLLSIPGDFPTKAIFIENYLPNLGYSICRPVS